jgi:uncharacterized membrane protein YkoI
MVVVCEVGHILLGVTLGYRAQSAQGLSETAQAQPLACSRQARISPIFSGWTAHSRESKQPGARMRFTITTKEGVMTVWRTYIVGLVGFVLFPVMGFLLLPVMALAGPSQSGQQRAGQQDRSQPQYSQQELQQIQQLARQGEQQQQTLTIDQAIRQAQQETQGIVVEAALSFEGSSDQSSAQRSRSRRSQSEQGSQFAAGTPRWQIQVLNPEQRRVTQLQVDAQTGQITDRQEYQIQQSDR